MELSTQGSMGNNWYWRLFKMVVKSQKNPRTIAVVSINFSARPRDTFPCNGRSGSNICKKCTPQIVVHYSLLTTNVMFCWSRSRYCVNWPLIPDQNKTWSRSTLCWCIDSIVYRCASGPISVNSVRICEISRKSSISTRIQQGYNFQSAQRRVFFFSDGELFLSFCFFVFLEKLDIP